MGSGRVRTIRLTNWAGEVFDFAAKQTDRPPLASGMRGFPTSYYAARVSERSGCEPRGHVPLEVWDLTTETPASAWDGVSRHSPRDQADAATFEVDRWFHLWVRVEGDKRWTYLAPAATPKLVGENG